MSPSRFATIVAGCLLITGSTLAEEPKPRLTIEHPGGLLCVVFSTDGKTLASGSTSDPVRLWDSMSGKQLSVVEGTNHARSLAFNPDGKLLAVGEAGFKCTIWEVRRRTSRIFREDEGQSPSAFVTFSPNGEMLACGGHCQLPIEVFDVTSGKVIATCEGTDLNGFVPTVFAPDGKTMTAVSKRGIRRWDVRTGKEVRFTLSAADRERVAKRIADLGHADYREREKATREIESFGPLAVEVLAKSTAHSDAEIRGRVEKLTERLKASSLEARSPITSSFSPDGKTLAAVPEIGTVDLWDVSSGELRARLSGRATWAGLSSAFSPDGAILATGHEDGSITLWDVAARRERVVFKGHAGEIRTITFSPDGKLLASGGYDSRIKLWDVRELK
jgi:WD40 repeat protein